MNTNKAILTPRFQQKSDPLTLLLKDIFRDNEYLFTNAILEKIYLNLQQKNTLNE